MFEHEPIMAHHMKRFFSNRCKRSTAGAFAALCITLLLAGCSTPEQPPAFGGRFSKDLLGSLDITEPAPSKEATVKLAEAAVDVSNSLRKIAEVERAIHPNAQLPRPQDATAIGMAQQVSIDWNGPVEPLLKKVATVTHYRLRVLGNRPAIPVLVGVNAENTLLADIVRDVSFQAQKQADVVLYPRSHVIELRYLGA